MTVNSGTALKSSTRIIADYRTGMIATRIQDSPTSCLRPENTDNQSDRSGDQPIEHHHHYLLDLCRIVVVRVIREAVLTVLNSWSENLELC